MRHIRDYPTQEQLSALYCYAEVDGTGVLVRRHQMGPVHKQGSLVLGTKNGSNGKGYQNRKIASVR